jgi:hypothetical protein
MYKQLGGPDASLVSPLTLRPIAYLVAKRNEENETRYREVPFGRVDAIRQFDGAFLTHGNLLSGDIEKGRTRGCKTALFGSRWMANIL